MAASVNIGCSEERSGRQSKENGDCTSLSRSMYKRCKVSTTRDFPEGCGPFTSSVDPVLKVDIADFGSAKGTIVEDKSGGNSGDDTVKTCEDDSQHSELKKDSFPTESLGQTTECSLKNENPMVASHHMDGLPLANDDSAKVPLVGMEALEDTGLTLGQTTDCSLKNENPVVASYHVDGLPLANVNSEKVPLVGMEALEDTGLTLGQTTDCSLKNENPVVSSHHVDDLPLANDDSAKVPLVGMEALEDTGLTLGRKTDCSLKNGNPVVSSHPVDDLPLANDDSAKGPLVGMEVLEDTGLTTTANSVKCHSSMSQSSSLVGEVALPGGSKSLCDVNVSGSSACMEKAITRRYVPQGKLAAIRDFPPFCGRNAPCVSKDECLKKISLNNKRVGQHNLAIDDNPLEKIAATDMKEEENHIQDKYACKRKRVDIAKADPESNATKKVKKMDVLEPSRMKLSQENTREKFLTLPQESNNHQVQIGARKKVGFFARLDRSKAAIKRKDAPNHSGQKPMKKKIENAAFDGMGQLVVRDKDSLAPNENIEDFRVFPKTHGFNVNVHDSNVIRNKVMETLSMFQALCRKLSQEAEGKSNERAINCRRVDLQVAKILKDKGKYVNTGKQILGSVPGVEVGDKFQYRVELNMIGLHRPSQGGIDYVNHNGKILATSIVASGGYADELDNSDVLIYTGQGGNVMCTDKEPEDQKLERGNLALKNSGEVKNPVRVIRGYESMDGKPKALVYDGLYLVESYWQEMGPHGKLVYKFQMRRIPGQPKLAFKKAKKSKMWF